MNSKAAIVAALSMSILGIAACASSDKANHTVGGQRSDTLIGVSADRFSGRAIRSDTSQAVITLERMACFGTCPIYTVAIYEDGLVVFRGDRFVDHPGLHVGDAGSEGVAELLGIARRIAYTSMADRYEGSGTDPAPTDLPAVITSVRFGSSQKEVFDYWGAPDKLHEFEQRIDEIAATSKWIGNGGADATGTGR